MKKGKQAWKRENFILIRDIRTDSKWTFLNNEFKEKGETMLEKVKQFFRRRSAKTEPSVDILPRNRFADLDFERESIEVRSSSPC